jgi:hypothetical protein
MMVTRGMLDEPARRGGVLAGLGLAGSLRFSPVSLGRDRVKERQPDGMIRCRRLGLAALSSPAGAGFYFGVGTPLAGSLIQSRPGSITPRVTCGPA